jgi:hypothetical protein
MSTKINLQKGSIHSKVVNPEQKKALLKKVNAVTAEKETKVTNSNKEAVTQKVITHRELLYIYPKGMTETLKRKAFRQKVRNSLRKFQRDIAKSKGEDKANLKAKFETYRSEHLYNA